MLRSVSSPCTGSVETASSTRLLQGSGGSCALMEPDGCSSHDVENPSAMKSEQAEHLDTESFFRQPVLASSVNHLAESPCSATGDVHSQLECSSNSVGDPKADSAITDEETVDLMSTMEEAQSEDSRCKEGGSSSGNVDQSDTTATSSNLYPGGTPNDEAKSGLLVSLFSMKALNFFSSEQKPGVAPATFTLHGVNPSCGCHLRLNIWKTCVLQERWRQGEEVEIKASKQRSKRAGCPHLQKWMRWSEVHKWRNEIERMWMQIQQKNPQLLRRGVAEDVPPAHLESNEVDPAKAPGSAVAPKDPGRRSSADRHRLEPRKPSSVPNTSNNLYMYLLDRMYLAEDSPASDPQNIMSKSADTQGASDGFLTSGWTTYRRWSSAKRLISPAVLRTIEVDIPRTFSSVFVQDKIIMRQLRRVLEAYALFDPVVSYVQGMNYIVIFLLWHATGEDTKATERRKREEKYSSTGRDGFVASFEEILEEEICFWLLVMVMYRYRAKPMYTRNMAGLRMKCFVVERLVANYHPPISARMASAGIHAELLVTDYFLTLCCSVVPFEPLTMLFDLFFRQGFLAICKLVIVRLFCLENLLLSENLDKAVAEAFATTASTDVEETSLVAVGGTRHSSISSFMSELQVFWENAQARWRRLDDVDDTGDVGAFCQIFRVAVPEPFKHSFVSPRLRAILADPPPTSSLYDEGEEERDDWWSQVLSVFNKGSSTWTTLKSVDKSPEKNTEVHHRKRHTILPLSGSTTASNTRISRKSVQLRQESVSLANDISDALIDQGKQIQGFLSTGNLTSMFSVETSDETDDIIPEGHPQISLHHGRSTSGLEGEASVRDPVDTTKAESFQETDGSDPAKKSSLVAASSTEEVVQERVDETESLGCGLKSRNNDSSTGKNQGLNMKFTVDSSQSGKGRDATRAWRELVALSRRIRIGSNEQRALEVQWKQTIYPKLKESQSSRSSKASARSDPLVDAASKGSTVGLSESTRVTIEKKLTAVDADLTSGGPYEESAPSSPASMSEPAGLWIEEQTHQLLRLLVKRILAFAVKEAANESSGRGVF